MNQEQNQTVIPGKGNNDKRRLIYAIIAAVLAAVIIFLVYMLVQKSSEIDERNETINELQQLAELDKEEMQNEYRQFDIQYGELQSSLRNDSLIAEIEKERERTQKLLRELENTKATDAREITRLKREITSLRKVLHSYIVQVDSLNRANESLRAENTEIRHQNEQVRTEINVISSERNQLRERVDRAAQLDATGFWISPKNKRGKDTQKVKDVTRFAFGFTIVKNVTAANGQRVIFARIMKPDNSVYHRQGIFTYENTQLEYSEKKYVEYDGEEMKVTMYSDVDEYLEAGTYKLFIFADNQMIGQTSFVLK